MGRKMGQGRGGLAPEEQTGIGFKTERGKVHTGKGAIIGQFLVDGDQVPGDVSPDLVDLVSAAERDASDLINRDRIPRQYQKAIKAYFSNVRRNLKDAEVKGVDKESNADDESESADAPAADDKDD